MKIIRHLTASGPVQAMLDEGGLARAISGSIFGDYAISEFGVEPGPLLAPIEPRTIFGIGLNYRKHASDLGRTPQAYPLVFMKSVNAVLASGGVIEVPRSLPSHAVDYEGELAVVIGREAKNVSEEDALDYVLGYTLANDVSARDWQFSLGGGQFCQSKSFDTFCPLGPVLVTADEISDPSRLVLRTHVNGELRQQGSTADMLFSVRALIAFLSASKTLLPGTVILTGSPEGVGHTQVPPRYLQAGDEVTVEVREIGLLRNRVADEGGSEAVSPGMAHAKVGHQS